MIEETFARDETSIWNKERWTAAKKMVYLSVSLFAFISGLVIVFASFEGLRGENTRDLLFLGVAGILAALTLVMIVNLLENVPEVLHTAVSHTRWDYTWIPILTTSALLIGDGIALNMFLESDKRTKNQDNVIIGPYLLLFFLSLLALGFFWIKLDHVAGIFVAVLSNGMGLILAGYETYNFDNPFQGIGLALSVWSLIAILLNSVPGVTRTPRSAFILSPFAKCRLIKASSILVTALGSFVVYRLTVFIIEETFISNEAHLPDLIWLGFIIMPIIPALLVLLTARLMDSYPETALKERMWMKSISSVFSLSLFTFIIVQYGLWSHNTWL
ncbi:MAG: hypothetical protein ACFFB3_01295 [Candidatus Hodarchaeota archaeon]